MRPQPQGSRWFQNLLLVGFIAAVELSSQPVYRKFLVETANRACMTEAKAYASATLNALNRGNTPPAPPNSACSRATDASAGGSLDTDIIAKPQPPGDVTIRCDLNAGANCVEA